MRRLGSLEVVATRMALAIQHRGPDDAGAWADAQAGIALGHRRLSIVDLSPAGHQPMASAGGRFVIAFNGEIYNHLELRAELAVDRSSACLARPFGYRNIAGCLRALGRRSDLAEDGGHVRHCPVGCARAHAAPGARPLWRKAAVLRLGEWCAFVFGSELKALRAYPGFANPVSREALALYMRFTYVPAPYSIYQGIYKLEPGCLLSVCGQPPKMADFQPLRPPATVHGSSRCGAGGLWRGGGGRGEKSDRG